MFRSRGFGFYMESDSAPPSPPLDTFGLKGLIQNMFAPQLSSELERLFLPDLMANNLSVGLALPLRTRIYPDSTGVSPASSPGSVSPWDEFRTNGRDQDLDELDRLVRGMEVNNETPLDDDILPGLPGLAYPALSTSPGSDSSEASSDSYGYPSTTSAILSKTRLMEILREQERDRLARRRQKVKGDKICVFCRNNGEKESVYSTHQLKDAQGRVTCPVLYIYTCPICGASGEAAHTIKYCPLNPQDKKSKNATLKAQSPKHIPHHFFSRPRAITMSLFK